MKLPEHLDQRGILYLSAQDVVDCGGEDIELYISAMEDVFKAHAEGDFNQPPGGYLRRGDFTSERTIGRIISLPAYIGGKFQSWGIKWVASAPPNPTKYGIARANATVILNDLETGLPICVMNGTSISAMRTAAVTAVAEKFLARKDSKVLGISGAGPINIQQVRATLHVMKEIEELRIFDLKKENAQKLAEVFKDTLNCVVCDTPKEALETADIIITGTNIAPGEDYIEASWIKEGSFFSNVSLQDPKFEVVLDADKVVVDDWHHANQENRPLNRMFKQDLIDFDPSNTKAKKQVYSELGEIVAGKKKGRENDNERIFLNPMGLGIEDIAAAITIYKKALETGKGTFLER